jgi:hypothetical protein
LPHHSSLKALPYGVEHRPSFVDSRLLEEAKDPNTAPSRLLELCGVHQRCRELIAKNPNTPLERLLHLWAEFPEAMLENPATDLLLLENPAAFAVAAAPILRAIFSLPNTPLPFYYLVWDSTPFYRGLMASSASLPPELALLLSKSEDLDCRCALASNTALAKLPEIFALLEDDLFPAVRRAVAKNLALPFIYFDTLCRDEDSEVRENIAAHPLTPLHLLEELSHDKIREVRRAVQKNPATPEALKARLWYESSREKMPKVPRKSVIKDVGKQWLLPVKKGGPTPLTALLLRL